VKKHAGFNTVEVWILKCVDNKSIAYFIAGDLLLAQKFPETRTPETSSWEF
jgi:hypothetical protein